MPMQIFYFFLVFCLFNRQVNQGGGGDLQTAAGPGQNGNQPAAEQKDLGGEQPLSEHTAEMVLQVH